MKKTVLFFALSLMISTFTGCTCNHEWNEATCTEPKTCVKCQKTEGEPLGHSWIDATCTEPKTCETCGEIDGEPLGHIEGSMELYSTDNVAAKIIYKSNCKRCNNVINTTEEKIESFINNDIFDISPSDLASRMDEKFDEISGCTLMAQGSDNDIGNFGLVIGDSSTKQVDGAFLLSNKAEDIISYSNRNENGVTLALGIVYDSDELAQMLLATVLTFDPSLSFDEGKDVAKNILNSREYVENGIQYFLSTSDGSWVIGVGVD